MLWFCSTVVAVRASRTPALPGDMEQHGWGLLRLGLRLLLLAQQALQRVPELLSSIIVVGWLAVALGLAHHHWLRQPTHWVGLRQRLCCCGRLLC